MGSRLGPYDVLSALGAGGMGEVYRARDRRLERDVAIKVLPPHLSSSAQFRERFEREAKAISQLNHPHICVLHDVGHENGTSYLVMELLEGESLADRIARGPVPMEQVLRYGAQIGDALHRAHRQGIVHRDLKPGNIMITKAGAKLLDFGLAKAAAPPEPAAFSGLTEHKPLTAEGTIVGTFQYMAPEQLEGLEADGRTDIFALGTVLYEMATGRRAFDGKTKTSIIAAIVSSEPPPISQLQPVTPAAFEHVVKKCLAKDPEDRWQSAHDVAEELRWIGETGAQAVPLAAKRRTLERMLWASLLLIPVALFAGMMLRSKPQPPPSYHFTIPGISSTYREGSAVAISPDGQMLAFSATNLDNRTQVFVRRLDSFDVKAVDGTLESSGFTWTPDGKSLISYSAGKLLRIPIAGGTPQPVGEIDGGRGMAAGNGVILVGSMSGGIQKLDVDTGAIEDITTADRKRHEIGHILPSFLPDLDHFLFTTFSHDPRGPQHHNAYVASLKTRAVKLIGDFPSRVQYGGGYLFYVRDGILHARRFDTDKLEMTGEAVTVARDLRSQIVIGSALFDVAEDGTIAWRPREIPHRIVVINERSDRIATIGEQARYQHVRASADGSTIVVSKTDPRLGTGDIESYSVARPTQTRLTFEPYMEFYPVLSSDGGTLYYSSDKGGLPDIHAKPLDGTEQPRLVLDAKGELQVCDVSPDGRNLLYFEFLTSSNGDLSILPLGGGKPYPIVATPGIDRCGRFSRDGQSIAYFSDVSGRNEVYVKPLLPNGRAVQVSAAGGIAPRWSIDGRTLYFGQRDLRTLFAASRTGDSYSEPRVVFTSDRTASDYDVLPGGRFVVLERDPVAASPPIHVIVRWPDSLAAP